jgi:hypothetical protein
MSSVQPRVGGVATAVESGLEWENLRTGRGLRDHLLITCSKGFELCYNNVNYLAIPSYVFAAPTCENMVVLSLA